MVDDDLGFKSCGRAFKRRYRTNLPGWGGALVTKTDPAAVYAIGGSPNQRKGEWHILEDNKEHSWSFCGERCGDIWFILCPKCAVENGYIW